MTAGVRLSLEEGISLFKKGSLEDLKWAASSIFLSQHPDRVVTYVLDANPNYSNICDTHCSFCSFCRKKDDPEAFFKTVEEILQDVAKAKKLGATTVLLQGGLSDRVTLSHLVNIVQATLRQFPDVHPHFFSAPEIVHAAKISGFSVEEALVRLYDAGLRTIPGAGAEILTKGVHAKICPKKLSPTEWLKTHEIAHRIGFFTTATMMFGHVETDEDIVQHLFCLREVQDKTGGFLSFIPWSFKPYGNALGKIVPNTAPVERYYRIVAFSRIFLDNFPHITASWFGEGKQAGMEALFFGADDFGGTVFDESVHKAAGHVNGSSEDEMCRMITQAGCVPARRDSLFRIVNIFT